MLAFSVEPGQSMSSASLLERTQTLVFSLKQIITLREIAIGAGVTLPWLEKFVAYKIPNPGVNHVQKVHDFAADYLGRKA